jgi:D-apionate oxidoisomerase
MTKIALLGAGGKMGVRLATNLENSRFKVDHVEVSEEGRKRLKDAIGADCVDRDAALAQAEVVLLAVPDRLIGKVSHEIIDNVRPGTALIVLDAAAPHARQMPSRKDVTYFVTHPCHPPIFNDETTAEAKKDFFGGIKAKQHIVCALMQGPEQHYALCEEVARASRARCVAAWMIPCHLRSSTAQAASNRIAANPLPIACSICVAVIGEHEPDTQAMRSTDPTRGVSRGSAASKPTDCQ